jgi:hypothetical protein
MSRRKREGRCRAPPRLGQGRGDLPEPPVVPEGALHQDCPQGVKRSLSEDVSGVFLLVKDK